MSDHYVTREEWEMLMARKRRSPVGGFFHFLFSAAVIFFTTCGLYYVMAVFIWDPFALPVQPPADSAPNTNTSSRPAARPTQPPMPPAAPISSGGIELPDCATVADTTTACVRTVDLQPPTATEAPAPSAEPTPPYEATCVSPPDGPPCWAPDAATLPLPETPIVLVPQWEGVPFTRDVCQDWHPPMPYPEGCDNE